MKTVRTPQQVREGMKNTKIDFSKFSRIPVIVTLPVSKGVQDLGIQFWTKEMIAKGESVNPDNTISKFVELY